MNRREFLQQMGTSAVALSSIVGNDAESFGQAAPKDVGVIQVQSSKQLFLDTRFIASGRGVHLAVNRPVPENRPVMVAEKPWEGFGLLGYHSVMEDEGEYKLWYDAIANDGSRWCCYATSKDGIHWEKPNLGVVPFQGDHNTNIVFPPTPMTKYEPNCVFKDTNPNCRASERYKMVYRTYPSVPKGGVHVAASPDGIHWNLLGDLPAFGASDTNNICFFDNRIGRYVGYVRVWDPMRKVGRCEFDDITKWGKEEVVFSYDAEDQQGLDRNIFAGMDFYTSAALKYPDADDAYFIFPSAYYRYTESFAHKFGSTEPKNDGVLDIQFAASRDGIAWNRPDRKPFIRRGLAGGFASGYAYMASGCVLRPEEVWLYYGVSNNTHGNYRIAEQKYTGAITRATLRRDGFMSVDADYAGGEFITPSLRFSGRKLILNVDTSSGGCVRVGVLPESGLSIEGFSTGDCDPINGNFISKVVSWRGKPDVSALSGKPIRLHFAMNDTKLYSFKFE